MKNAEQVNRARDAVVKQLARDDLGIDQYIVLQGMSVALCWVADAGGNTLDRIVNGDPIPGTARQDYGIGQAIAAERERCAIKVEEQGTMLMAMFGTERYECLIRDLAACIRKETT